MYEKFHKPEIVTVEMESSIGLGVDLPSLARFSSMSCRRLSMVLMNAPRDE